MNAFTGNGACNAKYQNQEVSKQHAQARNVTCLQGYKTLVIKEEDGVFCKLEMVISKEVCNRYFLHVEILFLIPHKENISREK